LEAGYEKRRRLVKEGYKRTNKKGHVGEKRVSEKTTALRQIKDGGENRTQRKTKSYTQNGITRKLRRKKRKFPGRVREVKAKGGYTHKKDCKREKKPTDGGKKRGGVRATGECITRKETTNDKRKTQPKKRPPVKKLGGWGEKGLQSKTCSIEPGGGEREPAKEGKGGEMKKMRQ